MAKIRIRDKRFDLIGYLVVLMMIATSGANWSILLLAIPCAYIGVKRGVKGYNIMIALILSSALLVNSTVLASASFDKHEYIVFLLRFLSVAVICSFMTYEMFMEKYLDIIRIIYVISFIFWVIGLIQNVFSISILPSVLDGYFNYESVGIIPRMRGIFWEAGVCQLHGNIALLYLITNDRIKRNKKLTFLYIIGILCTMSTTGFLILVLQFVLYFIRNYKLPCIGRRIILILMLGVILIVVEESTVSIIMGKLLNNKASGTSRFDDSVIALMIAKDHFWAGIGLATYWRDVFLDYFYNNPFYLSVRKYYMPDLASSNGLFNCLYKTGTPFTLYYILKIYNFFRKKAGIRTVEAVIALMIYVFIFIGEPIMSVPLMLMFFYQFKCTDKEITQSVS